LENIVTGSADMDLLLQIHPTSDDDDERLDSLARSLQRELDSFGTSRLLADSQLSAGAKAGEALVVGALAIRFAPYAAKMFSEFIVAWTKRKTGRQVTVRTAAGVELVVKGDVSPDSIERLLNAASSQIR